MFGRNRIARIGIIATAAVLLIFLSRAPVFGPWRGRLADAIAPLLAKTRAGALAARSAIGGSQGRRIRALEAERVRLLAEIAGRDEARRDNETLRAALKLREAGATGAVASRVIGFLREGRDEFLVLDRGTRDGVAVGDIVVDSNQALGGTIVEVSDRASRMILLASASRSMEISLPRINLRAIARGNNSRELVIELVPNGADLKEGDLVTASPRATGGRSFLIGEIREAAAAEHQPFKTVRAVHLFDPGTDNVIILAGF